MMPQRFWRCVSCEAVIRLTEHDDVPAAAAMYPLWWAAAREEQASFLETHRAHLLELLVQTSPIVAASGPVWDPVTTLWWEVSNAARHYVIEGTRLGGAQGIPPNFDGPLSYRCVPGRLHAVITHVGIPESELARALDGALFPHVLPMRKLELLTHAASQGLAAIDPDALELLHDSPTDPTVSTARLPAEWLERLIASLRPHVLRWEYDRLDRHLRRLHDGDELLLSIGRRYEIRDDA